MPFEASNPAALFKKICSGEFSPPEQFEPKVSRQLNSVICKALALNRAERFQSAAELAKALQDIANTLSLGPIDEALAAYYAAPEQYIAEKLPLWLEGEKEAARQAAAARHTGEALAHYERLCTFCPDNQELAGAIKHLLKKEWRCHFAKTLLIVLLIILLLSGGAFTLFWTLPPDEVDAPLNDALSDSAMLPEITGANSSDAVTDIKNPPNDTITDKAPIKPPAENMAAKTRPAVQKIRALVDKTTHKRRERNIPAPPPAQAAKVEDPSSAALSPAAKTPKTPPPAEDATAENQVLPVSSKAETPKIPVTFHAFPFASIWIDNKLAAQNAMTPITVNLSPGTHKVRFEHPAAHTLEETYSIDEKNNEPAFRVHMQPLPAKLILDIPEGSLVELGDERWLTSPYSKNEGHIVELPDKAFRHSYKVTITEPGRSPWSKVVEFKAGETVRLTSGR
jgi:hypothetical protein